MLHVARRELERIFEIALCLKDWLTVPQIKQDCPVMQSLPVEQLLPELQALEGRVPQRL
jgi:hypothetical protein